MKHNITKELNSQNTKKLISISPEHYEALTGYIHDMALVSKCADSTIIENHLLYCCLTKDKQVQYYLRGIYTRGLQATIAQLFQDLAAGTDYKPAYSNGELIMAFAMKSSAHIHTELSGEEPLLYHFIANANAVLDIVRDATRFSDLSTSEKHAIHNFEHQIHLLPNDFEPMNYYWFIKNNWGILHDKSYTYRLLYDLVSLTAEWDDGPLDRMEACDMIKDIVGNWG